IRFGDNDRLAALVAHLVHADLLGLLSDVDGLHGADPRRPEARPITEVRGPDDLAELDVRRTSGSGVGSGGMVTKVESAQIATEAGIEVVLTHADQAEAALCGRPTGTRFHPTGRRRPTRLVWLAHATEPHGQVVIDSGAVRAVVERRKSLLPAGITTVVGSFDAGDPVDLVDPDGEPVARGLVNYSSSELPRLIGRSTAELARELGSE